MLFPGDRYGFHKRQDFSKDFFKPFLIIMITIRDVVSNGVGGTEYAQPMIEGGRGQIMVIIIIGVVVTII